MANGLYLTPDGTVMVDYGHKKIPIPLAQYKANGYRPPFYTLARDNKARTSAGEAGPDLSVVRCDQAVPGPVYRASLLHRDRWMPDTPALLFSFLVQLEKSLVGQDHFSPHLEALRQPSPLQMLRRNGKRHGPAINQTVAARALGSRSEVSAVNPTHGPARHKFAMNQAVK